MRSFFSFLETFFELILALLKAAQVFIVPETTVWWMIATHGLIVFTLIFFLIDGTKGLLELGLFHLLIKRIRKVMSSFYQFQTGVGKTKSKKNLKSKITSFLLKVYESGGLKWLYLVGCSLPLSGFPLRSITIATAEVIVKNGEKDLSILEKSGLILSGSAIRYLIVITLYYSSKFFIWG